VLVRIGPSCFCTIPLLTHRPNPVPFSSFVVKKGSKSFPAELAGIPEPLSAKITRTPRRLWYYQSRPGDIRTFMDVETASSGLLISCEMDAAMRPAAANFSDFRSAAPDCRCRSSDI
jgi:hypothetical protein